MSEFVNARFWLRGSEPTVRNQSDLITDNETNSSPPVTWGYSADNIYNTLSDHCSPAATTSAIKTSALFFHTFPATHLLRILSLYHLARVNQMEVLGCGSVWNRSSKP
jgi:hypothetical protein